jgi:Domain of unknown function (DU1801)
MRTDTSRGTFDDVIGGSPAQIVAIAHKLRDTIAALHPDILEVPRPAEQHADYGIGPDQRHEIFVYICPMPKYVRLGFYYGAALADPYQALAGAGKRLRHLKLASLAELESEVVEQLLAAALEERKQAPARR